LAKALDLYKSLYDVPTNLIQNALMNQVTV